MYIHRRTAILGAAAVLATPALVRASSEPAREIMFCIDISSSIKNGKTWIDGQQLRHKDIQMSGHVHALRTPIIKRSLVGGQFVLRAVYWAMGAEEWFDPVHVRSETDLELFIQRLQQPYDEAVEKSSLGVGTNHTDPLGYALDTAPLAPSRVVDVCTDGWAGEACKEPRDALTMLGTEINGVVIDKDIENPFSAYNRMLNFMVTNQEKHRVFHADDWSKFEWALEQKLFREVNV